MADGFDLAARQWFCRNTVEGLDAELERVLFGALVAGNMDTEKVIASLDRWKKLIGDGFFDIVVRGGALWRRRRPNTRDRRGAAFLGEIKPCAALAERRLRRLRGETVMQLDLFAVAVEDVPPSPSAYRKRLARVAALAHELGLRRGLATKRAIKPRSLGAAVVAAPVAVMPMQSRLMQSMYVLDQQERGELWAIIRRIGRLNLSHQNVEHFFIERSGIVEQLKQIARRV